MVHHCCDGGTKSYEGTSRQVLLFGLLYYVMYQAVLWSDYDQSNYVIAMGGGSRSHYFVLIGRAVLWRFDSS